MYGWAFAKKLVLYHCTDPTDIFYASLSFIVSVNLNICLYKTLMLLTSTPLFPSFSPLVFLMWFITVHSVGYIAPCSADRQCNWVMLQQFCQGNKTFALGLWTYIPKVTSREILSGNPRWQLSTFAEHMGGVFCSKMKEGVTRMRFIHLNKVDHQTDVAAEVLVRQRKKCKETERRGEKQTGPWERLLGCKHNVLFPASVPWIEQYLSTCWQNLGRKAHFVELLQRTF